MNITQARAAALDKHTDLVEMKIAIGIVCHYNTVARLFARQTGLSVAIDSAIDSCRSLLVHDDLNAEGIIASLNEIQPQIEHAAQLVQKICDVRKHLRVA